MTPACAHCHLLAAVLAADGSLGDDERVLLERHMNARGLSDAERDQVRHFEGADGAAEVLRGQPEEERRALVDDLVEAALTDGKLTHSETEAVKRIARELGLD